MDDNNIIGIDNSQYCKCKNCSQMHKGKYWYNKDANAKVKLIKETLNSMIEAYLGHRKY